MTCPIPQNEQERLKELKRLRVKEWGTSETLNKLCVLASQIMDTPAAIVSTIHENEQHFAGCHGLRISKTSRDAAICAHTIMSPHVLHVPDTLRDKRFAKNRVITQGLGVRSYVGIPLQTPAGIIVGTLCALDFRPRRFSHQKITELSKFAEIATSILETECAALELADEIAARRKREKQLIKLAHEDALTGLANFKALREKASRCLKGAKKDKAFGLLLMDLDNFKLINDQWGYAQGDVYLKRIAERLTTVVRKGDIVARIGGDEFAILMKNLNDPIPMATAVAERIRSNLKEIANDMGNPHVGNASIGIALAPEHGETLDQLQLAANFALAASKGQDAGTFRLYDPEIKRKNQQDLILREELKQALDAGSFVPYYQPKIDLETGLPVGFEALARWQHPKRGLLPPSEFLPALKDKELAPLLTQIMATKVAYDVANWRKNGLLSGPVSVNISPPDLMDRNFPKFILDLLSRHQLPPQAIAVEVTEIVVMGTHKGLLYKSLAELREAGISILLDDFGTGYAALQHLRDWPIDQIKIDRSFIQGCIQNPGDRAIVKAVVQLSAALGLSVIAEGIETNEQLNILQAMHCNHGQGYLFAKPMASDEVPLFLRSASSSIVTTVH